MTATGPVSELRAADPNTCAEPSGCLLPGDGCHSGCAVHEQLARVAEIVRQLRTAAEWLRSNQFTAMPWDPPLARLLDAIADSRDVDPDPHGPLTISERHALATARAILEAR